MHWCKQLDKSIEFTQPYSRVQELNKVSKDEISKVMEAQRMIQGSMIVCCLWGMIKAQMKELKSSEEQQQLG